MSMKTKVRKVGNSYGIVLPREAMHAMKVKEGDTVYLTETPESGIRITAADERFDEMMNAADRAMRTYRNALRKLGQ